MIQLLHPAPRRRRRNLSDNHRRWCLGQLYERRKGEKGGDRKSKPQSGALIAKGSVRDQIAETGDNQHTLKNGPDIIRTAAEVGGTSEARKAREEQGDKVTLKRGNQAQPSQPHHPGSLFTTTAPHVASSQLTKPPEFVAGFCLLSDC